MKKLLIALLIFPFACSTAHRERVKSNSETYYGGSFGYFYSTLILYADSTYSYDFWSHTKSYIKDVGVWKCKNNRFFLISKKTKHKTQFGRSKERHFINTEFKKSGDSILFTSVDTLSNKKFRKHLVLIKKK